MWFSLQLFKKSKATFPAHIDQRSKRSIYTFIVPFLFTIACVALYVFSEKTFYWWDYITYSEIVDQKFSDFLRSPFWTLQQVWWSTNKDYSDYPALLLLPFRAIFGSSRFGFVLSIAIAYLLPLALCLSAIAKQLIPNRPKLVHWSSLIITALTPVFWAPTVRGYVDAGGALMIAAATLIYLRDRSLSKRWQVIAIGFLLGFLPLFRRHFLYAGIAFFVAMLLQAGTDPWQQWRPDRRLSWHYTVLRLRQIGWTGLVSLATFVLLGLPFIVRLFTVDFGSLYAAYEVSLTQALQYYGISYGWIACLLAALGFAVGYRKRIVERAIANFIGLLYGSIFLFWMLSIRIVGVHYTSHFTPAIVLGLVVLLVAIEESFSGRKRRIALGALGTYLGINALLGMIPTGMLEKTVLRPTQFGISIQPMQQGTKLSELFSASYAPLRRTDYAELERLTKTLKAFTPNQEPIYIGGASSLFNASLLKDADLTLHQQKTLNILPAEDIDSRDQYPLERLLQANYVVVASPFQHDIQPEDQGVVKVVTDIFQQRWQLSKDFKQLQPQFQLDKNVSVSIYQRIRETTLPSAIATLKTMKTAIGTRPGGQADWIVLDHDPSFFVWRGRNLHHIYPELDHNTGKGSFLYVNPPFPKEAHFTAKIDYNTRTCPGVEIRLNAIDNQAQTRYRTKQVFMPTDAPSLSLRVPTDRTSFLLLELASLDQLHTQRDLVKFRDGNRCQLRLNQLKMSSEP